MKVLPKSDETPTSAKRRKSCDVASLSVTLASTVAEVISRIDCSGRVNIAVVVDEDDRLLNTISDGDVRRGILAGVTLQTPVARLLEIKARTPHPLPVCATYPSDDASLIELMQTRAVRQIPLVDSENRVVDIVSLFDVLPEQPCALQAIVMAGGFGKRLRPLTETVPKPMLPIAGRPLIELIVNQLRCIGIVQICIATHFRAETILRHFGDGSEFGVHITYTSETSPLGTGGALGLMDRPNVPVIVMNGDIMTDIDFGAMHAFHQDHNATMTVAVRRYEVQIPYGVVHSAGVRLRRLREKPSIGVFVNAGIYLLDPKVYEFVVPGAYLNMTDLIEKLLRAKEPVVTFPVREHWLDIGQHADYERAQAEAAQMWQIEEVRG